MENLLWSAFKFTRIAFFSAESNQAKLYICLTLHDDKLYIEQVFAYLILKNIVTILV